MYGMFLQLSDTRHTSLSSRSSKAVISSARFASCLTHADANAAVRPVRSLPKLQDSKNSVTKRFISSAKTSTVIGRVWKTASKDFLVQHPSVVCCEQLRRRACRASSLRLLFLATSILTLFQQLKRNPTCANGFTCRSSQAAIDFSSC